MIMVLVGLIVLNALLAMSEMALVSVRKARLQKYLDQQDKGAIAALRLSENPSEFMSAITIGITTITILNGIICEATFSEKLADYLTSLHVTDHLVKPISMVLVVALSTYIFIVLGELVPKRLGQISPEKIARIAARPIQALSRWTHPLVVFLSASTSFILKIIGVKNTEAPQLTQEEIQALIAEGSQTGLIDEQEHQMVKNVFRLDLRSIGSLMVPRADLVWLSTEASIDETIKVIEGCHFTRFPVCRDNVNDVVGIITAKKYLSNVIKATDGILNIETIVSEPLYVPESLNAMELLNELRDAKSEMALVVDEYGDIQGIVTMQDLLEAITGQFDTSNPNDAFAIQRENGAWLLDGLISNHDLKDHLGIKSLPEEDKKGYNTLSGLMMLLLGRIPKTLDAAEWDGWRFEIIDMDGMRIDKVMATLIEQQPPIEDDTDI